MKLSLPDVARGSGNELKLEKGGGFQQLGCVLALDVFVFRNEAERDIGYGIDL